jgi:hypothetical protein
MFKNSILFGTGIAPKNWKFERQDGRVRFKKLGVVRDSRGKAHKRLSVFIY